MKKYFARTVSDLIVNMVILVGMFIVYIPGTDGALYKSLDYVYMNIGLSFTSQQITWIATVIFVAVVIMLAIDIGIGVGKLINATSNEEL